MAKKRKRSVKRPRIIAKSNPALSIHNIGMRILPFILILALIGIGVKLSASLLFDSDYFSVKAVHIAGEPLTEKAGSIEKRLSSKKGLNIFRVDLKACESVIKNEYPELKDIKVSRVLPDGLRVSYKIRKPYLQIDSGYYYLVSDDAVLLPKSYIIAEPGLTIVTGIRISDRNRSRGKERYTEAIKKAIALLKEIEGSGFSRRHKILKINMYDLKNPAIFIEGGTRVEIGEYDFNDKKPLLEEVLNELESKNRKARVIDLRFEDVVVIPN